MKSEKATWKDILADALRASGGQSHLSEINERVEGHPKTRTNPTWRETIRRVVRQYKIFQPVPPDRSGIYRLVEAAVHRAEPQNLDSTDEEMNHGIAQGMLVSLGGVYGYETYVPAHDQAARHFQSKRLGDLVTVKDCTDLFRGPNARKVREIDVLWFDEDDYGLFPLYAFEVEHTTKVRNGLDRLLKIPARFPAQLFIVGPGEQERSLFDRFVSQTPFRGHRHRFTFRLYQQLEELYNAAIRHNRERGDFGLLECHRMP